MEIGFKLCLRGTQILCVFLKIMNQSFSKDEINHESLDKEGIQGMMTLVKEDGGTVNQIYLL